ncbi:MAG: HlyD family efflux transporter periplasmic adaptor subunit [Deltaproteobacteria bacterium]|nr:HlyD family efflux transporter periplasmic adaptor subunit [Deltaproteobacteria bacterium]
MNKNKGSLKGKVIKITALAVMVSGLIVGGFRFLDSDKSAASLTPTFTVMKGPLKISVTETGTIQAREKIIVKNEVEGKTSIITLIDEGARVKEGDLLIELDASNLLDLKVDQEIKVQNTEASFISAREDLAVVENQARSDIDKAQLAYDFAMQDLEKYIKGEYPNQLKEAEAKITLAEEEVARAQDKLEWSKKLYDERYISKTELQADELAEKKKVLDLELVKNDLDLLINYTHKRRVAQLESDVKQAEMALERMTRKAKADVVQAMASLKARESEYNQQKDKLKKTESQIEKTKIYAPADGLVIYATSASGGGGPGRSMMTEPLEEGQQVRERQDLIHLPTSAGYNAEIGVYEASLDKVRTGFPVVVTVEALPGERFTGRVSFIAPLPDARSAFLNPALKVYKTVIQLDNTENTVLLRAGMGCTAEIIVEQFKDALYVPIQSVIRVENQPTAYLVRGKEQIPRKVEIGLDNNRMVRIISGLEPGEIVSLAPPLVHAAAVETAYKDEIIETEDIPDRSPQASPGLKADSSVERGGEEMSLNQPPRDTARPDGQSQSGAVPLSGGDFIGRLDKDGDGRVSRVEFPRDDDAFKRLDKDGDGFITLSEVSGRVSGGSGGVRSGSSASPQQGRAGTAGLATEEGR